MASAKLGIVAGDGGTVIWPALLGPLLAKRFLLTGDARATDPVCHKSPHHEQVTELAVVQEDRPYDYRRM